MPQRLPNQLKFRLERIMLRGPQYRLLMIAALIGLISVMGGAIIHYSGTESTGFGDAVWWAFLRLSDPGYLGDDTGTLVRTVSTVLTVLGYVLFLGALVAIMTQWLHERMRELEAGLTPIAQRDHILIIGWTNRTPTILLELVMSSERVRRFLRRRHARTLRIAILADEVTTALSVELRDRLGSLWNENQVILRTGSALRLEHLRRVDFIRASAVIMPAADFGAGGSDQADTRTIKTLLTMTNHPSSEGRELPLAVAEVFDSRKISIARNAYGGPVEILASDSIISRLLAQNVRHRGLSHVFGELLTHGRGNEIYLREAAELEGRRIHDARMVFPRAILLGVVRTDGSRLLSLLNPPAGTVIAADDRLVLLARSLRDTASAPIEPSADDLPEVRRIRAATPAGAMRVLILGWSHKVPALLREFDSYRDEDFVIDVVSTTPVSRRESALQRHDFTAHNIAVTQIEGDFTTPSILLRADPNSYDSIVLLGSDRLGSGEESDARSILAYLLLRELLPAEPRPNVLVELLDPGNMALFRRRRGEVIVSPLILSHMLAQVALRRELRAVFEELFGPGGPEIIFRPPVDYGLQNGAVTFAQIERAAGMHGDVALGVRLHAIEAGLSGGVALNPPRDRTFELSALDEIVALTTY
ncbi:MAG: ion channel DMI1 [Gemmatimonadetes bacterium]|nr:ion channel DMI1 [Gemmatimonadota bacterium]